MAQPVKLSLIGTFEHKLSKKEKSMLRAMDHSSFYPSMSFIHKSKNNTRREKRLLRRTSRRLNCNVVCIWTDINIRKTYYYSVAPMELTHEKMFDVIDRILTG